MDGLTVQTIAGCGPKADETAGGKECGSGIGVVEASRCEGFEVGDIVRGAWGWADHRVVHGADLQLLRPCHAGRPTAALGVLGVPGRAAYFGFAKILRPQRGDVVFISGGAGTVGACVAQLCKAAGCVVLGSTRSPAKEAYMKSVGFDKVPSTVFPGGPPEYAEAIKHMAPDGIQGYFDTTGGEISEGVWRNLVDGARVAVCGATSQCVAPASSLFPARGPPPKKVLQADERVVHLVAARPLRWPRAPPDRPQGLAGEPRLLLHGPRQNARGPHALSARPRPRPATPRDRRNAGGWEPWCNEFVFPEPDGRKVKWEAYCTKRFCTETDACDDAIAKLLDDKTHTSVCRRRHVRDAVSKRRPDRRGSRREETRLRPKVPRGAPRGRPRRRGRRLPAPLHGRERGQGRLLELAAGPLHKLDCPFWAFAPFASGGAPPVPSESSYYT